MSMQLREITLDLTPRVRIDIIDVAARVSEQYGNLFQDYQKTLCCSLHTTAGYLEQRFCARWLSRRHPIGGRRASPDLRSRFHTLCDVRDRRELASLRSSRKHRLYHERCPGDCGATRSDARVGSAANVHSTATFLRDAMTKRPWYKNWKVWTGIGLGVTVLGVGGYLIARR